MACKFQSNVFWMVSESFLSQSIQCRHNTCKKTNSNSWKFIEFPEIDENSGRWQTSAANWKGWVINVVFLLHHRQGFCMQNYTTLVDKCSKLKKVADWCHVADDQSVLPRCVHAFLLHHQQGILVRKFIYISFFSFFLNLSTLWLCTMLRTKREKRILQLS